MASRKEASVRATALKAGEAHLIDNLTPELAKSLGPDQVVSTRSTETTSIRFNCKTGITTDLRVRQAVAYCMDRESIVKDIYQGFGEMANGQLYNDLTLGFDPAIKDYPFDLEKAKALVKEAGVEGQEFVITGATANRWLKDREIMEAVGAMINKTGLKANVKLVELAEANNYFYEVANPVVQASFTSPSSDLVDADRVLANYAEAGRTCVALQPSGHGEAVRDRARRARQREARRDDAPDGQARLGQSPGHANLAAALDLRREPEVQVPGVSHRPDPDAPDAVAAVTSVHTSQATGGAVGGLFADSEPPALSERAAQRCVA